MALRDYYRCKKCDAKVVYGPDRSDENWEPYLLCRDCIAELESRLAALDWRPITPESLPKVGDELYSPVSKMVMRLPEGYAPMIPMPNDFIFAGWTHFRPINDPQEPAKEQS